MKKEFTLSKVHPEPVEGKRYPLPVLFLVFVSALLTGCGTMKQVQVVERVQKDTLYLNHIQYDSIFVENQTFRDYRPSLQVGDGGRPDTVYLEKSHIEYKYKLLRDTVRVVQIDSIPVIKTVEVVKTEKYIPKVYKWSFIICIILFCVFCVFCVIKIKF